MDIDGFEATRRIRAEKPPDRHTSIVVMTVYAMLGDRERLPHAGMIDREDFRVCQKPVECVRCELEDCMLLIEASPWDRAACRPTV